MLLVKVVTSHKHADKRTCVLERGNRSAVGGVQVLDIRNTAHMKHSGCMAEIGWSISTVTWRRLVAESDVQRRHVQRLREYLLGSPPSAEWEARVESWDEKREMFVKTGKSTAKNVSRGCGQGGRRCGGRVCRQPG